MVSLYRFYKMAKYKPKKMNMLEVHQDMAQGLYDAGIMDATTMREFEALCLQPVKDLNPNEINKIRLKKKVSQGVFAKFLNTLVSTVRQWEQGEKHPRGTTLKLLNIVANKGLHLLI